jgi:hypothetical protein
MNLYKICTLDVWGNEVDGYDINDYFTYKTNFNIEELDNFNEFCEEHLIGDPNQYELNDYANGFMEIVHKETGKPILHFYEEQ